MGCCCCRRCQCSCCCCCHSRCSCCLWQVRLGGHVQVAVLPAPYLLAQTLVQLLQELYAGPVPQVSDQRLAASAQHLALLLRTHTCCHPTPCIPCWNCFPYTGQVAAGLGTPAPAWSSGHLAGRAPRVVRSGQEGHQPGQRSPAAAGAVRASSSQCAAPQCMDSGQTGL